ncbi:MAG: alkaline phosphatase D family protein [Bradymonadia bacterium]
MTPPDIALIADMPTVGPIVGHTTETTIRLWARGDFMSEVDRPLRCHGVARVCPPGGEWSPHRAFPLRARFDFTGVVDMTDLTAHTRYAYQVGVVYHSGEPDDVEAARINWDLLPIHHVRTSPPSDHPISFVFGSCRYMLSILGGHFGDDRGDKAFGSILDQIHDGQITDLLLMVGDQIYADDLGPVAPDETLEAFRARYRAAFTEHHLRSLMGQVPTYMILDDHEIDDDWSQDRVLNNAETRSLFIAATQSYESYQAIHGPRYNVEDKEPPRPYWYTFEQGAASFFVLDTRTERFKRADPPQIISDEQMGALLAWLESTEGLKFVVSSVPFFPDSKISKEKWNGFSAQRLRVLEHIRQRRLSPVVFLSGDLHASVAARLDCTVPVGDDDLPDPDFQVYSIVSSAFFWPAIHLPSWLIEQHDPIELTHDEIMYLPQAVTRVHSTDCFTRITMADDALRVEIHHRKGKLLESVTLPLITPSTQLLEEKDPDEL